MRFQGWCRALGHWIPTGGLWGHAVKTEHRWILELLELHEKHSTAFFADKNTETLALHEKHVDEHHSIQQLKIESQVY